MIERWRNIEGFEGKYQISNTGKVKSLTYNNTNQEKLMQPRLNKKGVYTINLWKNNKAYQFSVALLVARHFLKKENETDVVIHIGDKTNDDVRNLKYVSLGEARYKNNIEKKKEIRVIDEIYTTGEIREQKKIAKQNGIKEHQLYKRLYEGWTLDEAVNIPMDRKERILNKKLYEYNGKLYSVKQLAELTENISERTMYKRLARGWSVEDSVEIPLARVKGGKYES